MALSTGYKLEEKVAIITGSTSGIGRECAVAFAREGCFVTVTGRNSQDLEAVTKECYDAGLQQGKVLTIQADVTIDADVERIISKTVDHFGQLDILVNNAGLYIVKGLEEITMEDYDRQLATNTRAPFLLMKLAVPHLLKTKGNIVNISSVFGLRPFTGRIAYMMSKAAMDQLTRCASLELGARGVRVNSVNPGVIETNLFTKDGMKLNDEDLKKFIETCNNWHPMKRVGQSHEVANAVLFLASNEKASFVTGTTFSVDGGIANAGPSS